MPDPTPKRKGRPPGSGTGRKSLPLNISIDDDSRAWLEAQPGGPSKAIRALILVAMERHQSGAGHVSP